MSSFNQWAPDLSLKPSKWIFSVSLMLIFLALSSLLLLPFPAYFLVILALVILLVSVIKMRQQILMLSEDAIVKIYYRNSCWWLETRGGHEYQAILLAESVVSSWFVLLNFKLEVFDDEIEDRSLWYKMFYDWRNRRSVLILPDSLKGKLEKFRRLKVFLLFANVHCSL